MDQLWMPGLPQLVGHGDSVLFNGFLQIEGNHLSHALFERYRLLPNGRVRLIAYVDDFVSRSLGKLFRRPPTKLGGLDLYPAD
jgi:hypothetical protein